MPEPPEDELDTAWAALESPDPARFDLMVSEYAEMKRQKVEAWNQARRPPKPNRGEPWPSWWWDTAHPSWRQKRHQRR